MDTFDDIKAWAVIIAGVVVMGTIIIIRLLGFVMIVGAPFFYFEGSFSMTNCLLIYIGGILSSHFTL